MVDILVRHTGQPEARIAADIDRDYILRGEAALAYGLADDVVPARPRALPGAPARELLAS
jgi:ATP-dependent Clp protease protease subunit